MTRSRTRRVSFFVPMLTAALIVVGWRAASAGPCISDGQTCRSDQSCCSGVCVKSTKKSFGTCCSPTTCAAEGANCGLIADGCGGTLDCGACTLPQTCGGGGTPNVCGTAIQCCVQSSPMGAFDTCTVEPPAQCFAQGGIPQGPGTCSPNPCSCSPTTCAAEGANCGTIADGCGGTLDCGTCTLPETCGGSGTPNVCAPPTGKCLCGFLAIEPGASCPSRCGASGLGCGTDTDCAFGECSAPPPGCVPQFAVCVSSC